MSQALPETQTRPGGFTATMARGLGVTVRRTVAALSYPGRALRGVLGLGRRAWQRGTARSVKSKTRAGQAGQAGLLPFSSRSHGVGPAIVESHFEAAEVARSEGLAALARTLADPDPSVRIRSLEVICEFSEDRAARLLAGMLHDPEPVVRCEAAASAARLRASGVIFSLILALEDPRDEVRTASARAIAEITGREMPTHRLDDPGERSRLVDELKRWWKEERFTQLATAVNARPRR